MTGSVSRDFRAGELVLDTSAGCLASANAFLQLSDHCIFVVCGKGSACFYNAHPTLGKVYLGQVLISESVIVMREEAIAVS